MHNSITSIFLNALWLSGDVFITFVLLFL